MGVLWDAMTEGEAKEALEGIKNASGVNHVSGLYEEHCKEAVALEKALEKLNGKLEQQKMDWEAGISCLKSLDGRGMVKKMPVCDQKPAGSTCSGGSLRKAG